MSEPSPDRPLRLASVGLGNWAGRIADLLVGLRERAADDIELVSVCEPNLAAHTARVSALRAAGVNVVDSFDAVLNDPTIDAVCLPVPIHLHRPMTEAALAAGKAVLVEKPATGSLQDLDAMIAARDAARRPALVSFQDTYDPAVLAVKRATLRGAVGVIRSATIVGCWPRDEAYYHRTSWAGAMRHAGAWVLDSPVSNAFAHYVNLALFLLGPDAETWAQPESVEAELYRAYDIENYDTTSVRFEVASHGQSHGNGNAGARVPVLTLLTHVCRRSIGPVIELRGERGTVRVDPVGHVAKIEHDDGRAEEFSLAADSRAEAVIAFSRHVRGLPVRSALATLEAARAHLLVANGASEAADVRGLSAAAFDVTDGEGSPQRAIAGIEEAMLACAAEGKMLHESGRFMWTVPAGRASLVGYRAFRGRPTGEIFPVTLPRSATANGNVSVSVTVPAPVRPIAVNADA